MKLIRIQEALLTPDLLTTPHQTPYHQTSACSPGQILPFKYIYIYQHSRRVPDRLKPWPMKIRNQKISKQENQKYGLHQEHFKTVIKV